MRSLSEVVRFAKEIRTRSFAVASLTGAMILVGGGHGARAGFVASGNSSGVAISSNLSLLNLVTADVSVNPLSGTAPSAYNTSSTIAAGATISSGGFLTGTLLTGSTGLLTTTAASTVDGSSTSASAMASTTINNLSLHILGNLVTIGATQLTSSSLTSGTYGSLTSSSGTPTISGLAISVAGVDVTSLIQASAGTLVTVNAGGLVGLQIGIDIATHSGNGTSTSGLTFDNIVVNFSGVQALGLTVNGSLDVGQSQSALVSSPSVAVPEPSSMAMTSLALILGGAAAARRGSKRKQTPSVA